MPDEIKYNNEEVGSFKGVNEALIPYIYRLEGMARANGYKTAKELRDERIVARITVVGVLALGMVLGWYCKVYSLLIWG